MTSYDPAGFPQWLQLMITGPMPNGAPEAIRRCADAWAESARRLEETAVRLEQLKAGAAAQSISGATGDAIRAQLDSQLEDTRTQVEFHDQVAKFLYEAANQIELAQYLVYGTAVALLIQLAVDVAMANAPKAAYDRMQAKIAMQLTARDLLRNLWQLLRHFALGQSRLALAVRSTFLGASINGATYLAAQYKQFREGNRAEIDWQGVGIATAAGAAGGLAGAEVARVVAPAVSRAAAGAASAQARITRHIAGVVVAGGAAGAVGGLAGGLVAWQLSDGPLRKSDLMTMVLTGVGAGIVGAAGGTLRVVRALRDVPPVTAAMGSVPRRQTPLPRMGDGHAPVPAGYRNGRDATPGPGGGGHRRVGPLRRTDIGELQRMADAQNLGVLRGRSDGIGVPPGRGGDSAPSGTTRHSVSPPARPAGVIPDGAAPPVRGGDQPTHRGVSAVGETGRPASRVPETVAPTAVAENTPRGHTGTPPGPARSGGEPAPVTTTGPAGESGAAPSVVRPGEHTPAGPGDGGPAAGERGSPGQATDPGGSESGARTDGVSEGPVPSRNADSPAADPPGPADGGSRTPLPGASLPAEGDDGGIFLSAIDMADGQRVCAYEAVNRMAKLNPEGGIDPARLGPRTVGAQGLSGTRYAEALGAHWRRGGFASPESLLAYVQRHGGSVAGAVQFRDAGAHAFVVYKSADGQLHLHEQVGNKVRLISPDGVREWTVDPDGRPRGSARARPDPHALGKWLREVSPYAEGTYGIVFGADGRAESPLAGSAPSADPRAAPAALLGHREAGGTALLERPTTPGPEPGATSDLEAGFYRDLARLGIGDPDAPAVTPVGAEEPGPARTGAVSASSRAQPPGRSAEDAAAVSAPREQAVAAPDTGTAAPERAGVSTEAGSREQAGEPVSGAQPVTDPWRPAAGGLALSGGALAPRPDPVDSAGSLQPKMRPGDAAQPADPAVQRARLQPSPAPTPEVRPGEESPAGRTASPPDRHGALPQLPENAAPQAEPSRRPAERAATPEPPEFVPPHPAVFPTAFPGLIPDPTRLPVPEYPEERPEEYRIPQGDHLAIPGIAVDEDTVPPDATPVLPRLPADPPAEPVADPPRYRPPVPDLPGADESGQQERSTDTPPPDVEALPPRYPASAPTHLPATPARPGTDAALPSRYATDPNPATPGAPQDPAARPVFHPDSLGYLPDYGVPDQERVPGRQLAAPLEPVVPSRPVAEAGPENGSGEPGRRGKRRAPRPAPPPEPDTEPRGMGEQESPPAQPTRKAPDEDGRAAGLPAAASGNPVVHGDAQSSARPGEPPAPPQNQGLLVPSRNQELLVPSRNRELVVPSQNGKLLVPPMSADEARTRLLRFGFDYVENWPEPPPGVPRGRDYYARRTTLPEELRALQLSERRVWEIARVFQRSPLYLLVGLLTSAGMKAELLLHGFDGTEAPLFFGQQRLGSAEQPLSTLKVRTLFPTASAEESSSPEINEMAGLVGRLARVLSADEILQIASVLWGHMSYVGPRPLLQLDIDRTITESGLPAHQTGYWATIPRYGIMTPHFPGCRFVDRTSPDYLRTRVWSDLLYDLIAWSGLDQYHLKMVVNPYLRRTGAQELAKVLQEVSEELTGRRARLPFLDKSSAVTETPAAAPARPVRPPRESVRLSASGKPGDEEKGSRPAHLGPALPTDSPVTDAEIALANRAAAALPEYLGPGATLSTLVARVEPETVVDGARTRAKANARWWHSLTPEEREGFLRLHPHLTGNIDGIPYTARDRANRLFVTRDLERLLRRKPPAGWRSHELTTTERIHLRNLLETRNQLAAIERDARAAGVDTVQLIAFDHRAYGGNGRIAISLGDADTAQLVTRHIGGVGTRLRSAHYRSTLVLAQLETAMRLAPGVPMAAINDIGYRHPTTAPEVPDATLAEVGGYVVARDLVSYNATREALAELPDGAPTPVLHTLTGHSFGSTTVGYAGRDGRLADEIHQIILSLSGSPGAGPITHAEQFGIGAENVYVMAAYRDLITWLGAERSGGMGRLFNRGLGGDPSMASWGGRRVTVLPPDLPEFRGLRSLKAVHQGYNAYADPEARIPTESLLNSGLITVGRGAEATVAEHRTGTPARWRRIAALPIDPERRRAAGGARPDESTPGDPAAFPAFDIREAADLPARRRTRRPFTAGPGYTGPELGFHHPPDRPDPESWGTGEPAVSRDSGATQPASTAGARHAGAAEADPGAAADAPTAESIQEHPRRTGAHADPEETPPPEAVADDPAIAFPLDLEIADAAALRQAMADGRTSSVELVREYQRRIEALDKSGPRLNAVRALNPNALREAAELDAERARGHVRGPLHGIPVLVKDNIDVAGIPTTAGALALRDSYPAEDAFLISRLRAAGAVILGKTNLTEFANFAAEGMPPGYSALGGQVLNPYNPEVSPLGSSSGSGVAAAAGLAAITVGTETSGSIVSPAVFNSLVGVKPTVGLVSRSGILPVSVTQDSAGPLARTVSDAALLLTALTGVDPDDPVTATGATVAGTDYSAALSTEALRGKRIGVVAMTEDDLFKVESVAEPLSLFTDAQAVLRAQGATLVPVTLDIPDMAGVIPSEFKKALEDYFARLPDTAPIRTLGEVIRFNAEHVEEGAIPFGQSQLIDFDKTDLAEPEVHAKYVAQRENLVTAYRSVIDSALAGEQLDALLFIQAESWRVAPRAQYPSVAVPIGYDPTSGQPYGMSLVGTAFSEAPLLAMAYAYEQAAQVRRPPSELNPALALPPRLPEIASAPDDSAAAGSSHRRNEDPGSRDSDTAAPGGAPSAATTDKHPASSAPPVRGSGRTDPVSATPWAHPAGRQLDETEVGRGPDSAPGTADDIEEPLFVVGTPEAAATPVKSTSAEIDLEAALYVSAPEEVPAAPGAHVPPNAVGPQEGIAAVAEDDADEPIYYVTPKGLLRADPLLADLRPATEYRVRGTETGIVLPPEQARALRDFAKAYGEKLSGNNNRVYLIDDYVVREPLDDSGAAESVHVDFLLWPEEYRTVQALTETAVRIGRPELISRLPQILHVEKNGDGNVVFEIHRRIYGAPVASIFEEPVQNLILETRELFFEVMVPQDLLPLPVGYPESGDSAGFFHMLVEHIDSSLQEALRHPRYGPVVDALIPQRVITRLAEHADLLRSQPFRVLHGDITSTNVLLTEENEHVLVDFGLALYGPEDYEYAVELQRSPGLLLRDTQWLSTFVLPYVLLLDVQRVLNDLIRVLDQAALPQRDLARIQTLATYLRPALPVVGGLRDGASNVRAMREFVETVSALLDHITARIVSGEPFYVAGLPGTGARPEGASPATESRKAVAPPAGDRAVESGPGRRPKGVMVPDLADAVDAGRGRPDTDVGVSATGTRGLPPWAVERQLGVPPPVDDATPKPASPPNTPWAARRTAEPEAGARPPRPKRNVTAEGQPRGYPYDGRPMDGTVAHTEDEQRALLDRPVRRTRRRLNMGGPGFARLGRAVAFQHDPADPDATPGKRLPPPAGDAVRERESRGGRETHGRADTESSQETHAARAIQGERDTDRAPAVENKAETAPRDRSGGIAGRRRAVFRPRPVRSCPPPWCGNCCGRTGSTGRCSCPI
ncbi:amidase family protein [Nocardia sp. X0981]